MVSTKPAVRSVLAAAVVVVVQGRQLVLVLVLHHRLLVLVLMLRSRLSG
jgi:hypothetical protein